MTNYPSVLYVEDDASSRKLMKMLLVGTMQLSDVTMLSDSENFMEQVARLDPVPNLVFLDIHVKPHNGFEMLGMLRQMRQYERVPVIALTASVMNEEVQRLRQAGFSGCLSKPLDIDTFPEIVKRILNGDTIWHIFT